MTVLGSAAVTDRVVVTPGGHDPSVWAARLAGAPAVALGELLVRLGLPPHAALVLLAAHPDDESIGAGRLAAAWAATVGPVTAVLATGGEACVDHVAPRPPGLVARRLAEWRAALAVLGATPGPFLGLPDGGLTATETDLTTRLAAAVTAPTRQRPGPVVLAAPWRHDPHPDHRAVGRAAAAVAAREDAVLIEYPVWTTYWSDPDDPAAVAASWWRLQVPAAADAAYARACACFESQLAPLAAGLTPVVPAAMLAHQHTQHLLGSPRDGHR